MYLMQALIFCAVVGSNIHWQWTPNQYLASGIGAGLAWVATHIVVKWRDRQQTALDAKKRPPSYQCGLKSCNQRKIASMLRHPNHDRLLGS
jgi:hypothetical protein